MTNPTVKCTPQRLSKIVGSIVLLGSFRSGAEAAGVSEASIYKWLSDSRDQQKRGSKEPPLFFESDNGKLGYFHEHCQESKSAALLGALFASVEELRVGRTRHVKNPATGYKLKRRNQEFAFCETDQELIDAFNEKYPFEPTMPSLAKLRWEFDQNGHVVYETETVDPPSSLKQFLLRGHLPGTFGEKISVSTDSRISVYTHMPEPFIPPSRQPALDVGQLTALPSLDDVKQARLREAEARRPPVGERVNRPPGPVNLGDGPSASTSSDPPEKLAVQAGHAGLRGARADGHDHATMTPPGQLAPTAPIQPPWPEAKRQAPVAEPQDHHVREPGPEPAPTIAQQPLPIYARRAPATIEQARRLHDRRPASSATDPGSRTSEFVRGGDRTSGKSILR